MSAAEGLSVEDGRDSLVLVEGLAGAVTSVVGKSRAVVVVVPVVVESEEVEQHVVVVDVAFVFVRRLVGVGNASFPVSGSTTSVAVTTPCVGLMASGLPSHILYALRITDAARRRETG